MRSRREEFLFQVLVDRCWYPLPFLAPDPAWVTVLTVVTMIQSLRRGGAPGGRPERLPPCGRRPQHTHSQSSPLQRAGRRSWCGTPVHILEHPPPPAPAAWRGPSPYLAQAPCLCESLRPLIPSPAPKGVTDLPSNLSPCHPEPTSWTLSNCSRTLSKC